MATVSPTRVHLIRHGQSTWNRDGLVQGAYRGRNQSVLTDEGRAQAARAGLALGALVGHADWFLSGAGQGFLAQLREGVAG